MNTLNADMNNASDDEKVTREVQCTFKTRLPESYQVDESVEIQLSTGSTNKDLTQVVKEMILEEQGDDDTDAMKQVKNKKL